MLSGGFQLSLKLLSSLREVAFIVAPNPLRLVFARIALQPNVREVLTIYNVLIYNGLEALANSIVMLSRQQQQHQ